MRIGQFCTVVQRLEERVFEARQKDLFDQFVGKLSSAPVGQKDLVVSHQTFSFRMHNAIFGFRFS
jgi:hypothetical protein